MAEIFDDLTAEELEARLDGKADVAHLHPQYMTTAQGDGRYYKKAEVDQRIDSRAAQQHPHAIADITGLGDRLADIDAALAGASSGGSVDLSGYYTITQVDGLLAGYYSKAQVDTALASKAGTGHTHGLSVLHDVNITDVSDGQALVWNAGAGEWRAATLNLGNDGVTDHGALSGLGDDDHPQYLNAARGDARYYTKAEIDAAVAPDRVIVTADHTAQPEQTIAVNTAAAAITITAPASPAEGTYFYVGDVGESAQTNTITIDFNGQTFRGETQDFVIDVDGFETGLLFAGGTWRRFNGES